MSSEVVYRWKRAESEAEQDPDNRGHLSRSPGRGNAVSGAVRTASRSPLQFKTRPRFDGSRPRFTNETELQEKILALEDTVAEYERQKNNVMGTFQEFRERLVEKERSLEVEYSSKIISLSEEVLAAKRDFERRMKDYQAAQEKYEREKEQALEKLKLEHQKEIQLLEKRCSDHELLKLEQKYVLEIQRLEEERRTLKQEKERLGQAFEEKLSRAQSLYESELSAAKALYRNELEALRDHESALREELVARQEEFKDRLEDLSHQFQHSKGELARCKQDVTEMEERMRRKEAEVVYISKQLEEARREIDAALAKLQRVEAELDSTRQKYFEQQEQLTRKSDMLCVLENAKNKLEVVIQELQLELKSLKNKVAFLENERQNLESQSRTQAQLQDSQMQALQMFVETISKEKEKLKEDHEQQLENERIAAADREFKMKAEFNARFNDLERQHRQSQEQFESRVNKERTELRKQLESGQDEQYFALKSEKEQLEMRFNKLERELPVRLRQAEEECDRLREQMKVEKASLNEATALLHNLSDSSSQLKEELAAAQTEIDEYKRRVLQLKEKLAETHNNGDNKHPVLPDIEQLRMSIMEEFDTSWQQKLQDQLNKVRSELEEKYENEKATLLTEMQSIRKDELAAAEEAWHNKEMEYLTQVESLRDSLERERARLQSEHQNGRHYDNAIEEGHNVAMEERTVSVAELHETIDQLNETVETLSSRIRELEQDDSQSLVEALHKLQEEKENLSSDLQQCRQSLSVAHEQHSDEAVAMKSRIERYEAKIRELEREHESLRRESLEDTSRDLQDSDSNTNELEAAKLTTQLQNLQTTLDEHDRQHEVEIQRMQGQLEAKNKQIEQLQASVNDITGAMQSINSELGVKTRQILDMRSETSEYIRKREQQQSKAHKREVEQYKTEFQHVMQSGQQTEQELRQEIELLKARLAEACSSGTEIDNESTVRELAKPETGSVDPDTSITSGQDDGLTAKLSQMQSTLVQREDEIRRLKEERANLEDELVQAKRQQQQRRDSVSSVCTPPGGLDLEKKRDSVSSSSSSSRDVNKPQNSALLHRWHCMVKQAQEAYRKERPPVTPLPRTPCSRAASRDKSPMNVRSSRESVSSTKERADRHSAMTTERDCEQKSTKETTESDRSPVADVDMEQASVSGEMEGTERASRLQSRQSSSSSLMPPESRRAGSRSPAPSAKPKQLPISKRPAWRI